MVDEQSDKQPVLAACNQPEQSDYDKAKASVLEHINTLQASLYDLHEQLQDTATSAVAGIGQAQFVFAHGAAMVQRMRTDLNELAGFVVSVDSPNE